MVRGVRAFSVCIEWDADARCFSTHAHNATEREDIHFEADRTTPVKGHQLPTPAWLQSSRCPDLPSRDGCVDTAQTARSSRGRKNYMRVHVCCSRGPWSIQIKVKRGQVIYQTKSNSSELPSDFNPDVKSSGFAVWSLIVKLRSMLRLNSVFFSFLRHLCNKILSSLRSLPDWQPRKLTHGITW